MNKFATIAGLAVAATAMSATAETLLLVDLTVSNQVTITATNGVSAVTASGSDGIGVYLENFYGGSGDSLSETYISGMLTNAENPSDGSPNLFRGGAGSDPGLNIFSWSSDITVSFTAGSLAFVGSATFGLDPNEYADMLANTGSGDLWFPADTVDDLATSVVLGQWEVIPAPSSLALLGMGGLVAGRRRR